MYPYEERIQAVELYIKLGKRVRATIRQLGYPTKNSFKSWHEEYERCLDLSRGYVRAKPKYSRAQKEQAIEHYLERGRCIVLTIKALGYPGSNRTKCDVQLPALARVGKRRPSWPLSDCSAIQKTSHDLDGVYQDALIAGHHVRV